MRFARSGKAIDNDVLANVDKTAGAKIQHRVPVQIAAIIIHGVDVCIGISEFGVAQKSLSPVGALVGVTYIDQQIHPVIKTHTQKRVWIRILIIQSIYHGIQLQLTELPF